MKIGLLFRKILKQNETKKYLHFKSHQASNLALISPLGLVIISITGLTSLTLETGLTLTFLSNFDNTVFSSINANRCPMQFRGPAENGT